MNGLVGRLGLADLLLGIDEEDNGLTGDADEMSGRQAGRRDLLVGGSGGSFISDVLAGNGNVMLNLSRSGNNRFLGDGDGIQFFSNGGAQLISGSMRGGNERLCGDGVLSNDLGNDATMEDAAMGGRDLLVGRGYDETLTASHAGRNELYGSACQILGQVSSRDDGMWSKARIRGDIYLGEASEIERCAVTPQTDKTTGGTSVFRPDNGDDTIHDFHLGRDVIDFWEFGGHEFGELLIIQDGEDCVIALTGLAESDIRFG